MKMNRDRIRYALLRWRGQFKAFNPRRFVFDQVCALANALERRWFPSDPPKAIGGKLMMFSKEGRNLGHDRLAVTSVRGGMYMGNVEWSNQWNRHRFKAHPEAVFDQQCLAEIYACMREMK